MALTSSRQNPYHSSNTHFEQCGIRRNISGSGFAQQLTESTTFEYRCSAHQLSSITIRRSPIMHHLLSVLGLNVTGASKNVNDAYNLWYYASTVSTRTPPSTGQRVTFVSVDGCRSGDRLYSPVNSLSLLIYRWLHFCSSPSISSSANEFYDLTNNISMLFDWTISSAVRQRFVLHKLKGCCFDSFWFGFYCDCERQVNDFVINQIDVTLVMDVQKCQTAIG